MPTSGPLVILPPALRRCGSPGWQGLCSHLAHMWATSHSAPGTEAVGIPEAAGAHPPEVSSVTGNTQADDNLPSIGARGGVNCRMTHGPHTQLFGGARHPPPPGKAQSKPKHSQQPPGVVQNSSTLQCSKQNTEQCGYDHAPVTRGRMRAQFQLPHGPRGTALPGAPASTTPSQSPPPHPLTRGLRPTVSWGV